MTHAVANDRHGILAMRIVTLFILLVTLIAVMVPLDPNMPSAGLDPSWQLGLNQAVTQHLSFGKEIAFTYGPYAFIYTQLYSPSTDFMALSASLYLVVCYFLAILILSKHINWRLILSFCVALVIFPYSADAMLSLYPILVLLAVSYMITPQVRPSNSANESKKTVALIWLLFLPLGLLPLIKGSLIFACAPIIALCSVYLILSRHRLSVIAAYVSPISGLLLFWWFAGQHLTDLPAFFSKLIQMSSGYTNAMSVPGPNADYAEFGLAALAIYYPFLSFKSITHERLLLILGVSFVVFLSFKGGFVRHDGHAVVAAAALLYLSFWLVPDASALRACLRLAIITLCTFSIAYHYVPSELAHPLINIKDLYARAAKGLSTRIVHPTALDDRYARSMSDISRTVGLPKLVGTVDVYPWDIAYLVASGNKWNPRPVFQSYSAYTPSLAGLNREHLIGRTAPDHIFFSIGTIDNRLPALEDGASWPALLNNYTPSRKVGSFVVLNRSGGKSDQARLTFISESIHHFGAEAQVPAHGDALLFAKISTSPTLLGRLTTVLFKPPQLTLFVRTKDGELHTFRLISSMADSPFLLSPLVTSTDQFTLLYSNLGTGYASDVASIQIATSPHGDWFWSPFFTLELFSSNRPSVPGVANVLGLSLPTSAVTYVESRSDGGCQGSVDAIDGINPDTNNLQSVGSLLSVRGWLASSIEHQIVPKHVFITLSTRGHTEFFITTRKAARPDVNAYFHEPNLPATGYTALADISSLPDGNYSMGLAYMDQTTLHHCHNFAFPLNIRR